MASNFSLGFNTTAAATFFEHVSYAATHHTQLSTLEQYWWAHYAYWENATIATGLLAFWSHELVYFGRNLPWIVADALPSVFGRYKIQQGNGKRPTAAQQWECAQYVLLLHVFAELPLIVAFHPVCELFGLSVDVPFPTWPVVAGQIALFFVLEDAYHYWAHRFLHWGPMYRRVHRIHHQYAAPFGLAAEYASPVETLLLGLGTIGAPILLGALTGDVHLWTVLIWIVFRQFQAIDAHSGYDFPWSLRHWLPFWGGADWHDDHHRYFTGNYSSSFRYWDILMGTVAGPVAGAKRRELKRQKELASLSILSLSERAAMESSVATILTPDVTGAASLGSGTSPAGGKPAIILVPWDPDSPDHVERMRLQRVACGWKQDGAEDWRPLQREGKIGLHWIVLSPSHPETASRVAAHKSQFPDESAPLRDTCHRILGRGHAVSPEVAADGCLFVPVGHISLDGWNADPSLQTSAADGVYSITTFYVSKAMQGVGIGGAAVAECERMAVHDFGAKTMTLDTISNEDVMVDSPRRIALKRPILKVTNQDWYVRRGYEVYQRRPNAWFDTDATGKEWWCTAVCLRKTLV